MTERTVFLFRSLNWQWDRLHALLSSLPDLTIAGEVSDPITARDLAVALQPPLIFSALDVDGASAVPVLCELRAELPETDIVLFADRYTAEQVTALAAIRVVGYFLWDDLEHPAFLVALDALCAGAFAIGSRRVSFAFLEAILRPHRPTGPDVPLSRRERQVLPFVTEGVSDKEIAVHLRLGRTTVETYVARLVTKFGARNRTHLAAIAARQGLLDG